MRRSALLVGPLLLAALLAGCAGEPRQDATPPESSPGGASEPEGRTSTPAAGGVAGRTGVFTVTAASNWTAGYSVAGEAGNVLGSGHPVVNVKAANLTGAIVEMHWTPSTPLSETLELSVWRLGGGMLDAVEGTAPLRLAFPGDRLSGELVLYFRAHDAGAFVKQEAAFHVTTFEGVPFDEAHTAVPG